MRVNIGSGRHRLSGFVNVDLSDADVIHDLTVIPWPFESGSVEWVNAGHILEHFDKADCYRVLAEARRILRHGGRLTVAVPDLDKFIEAHLSGNFMKLGGYQWTDLNSLMGGGEAERDIANRHRQMYCYESLTHMLASTGFWSQVRDYDPAIDDPDYAAMSLYMEARK